MPITLICLLLVFYGASALTNSSCDKCIRKCCPPNHYLLNKLCVFSNQSTFNPLVYNGTEITEKLFDFQVISANNCESGDRRLFTMTSERIFLQENGDLLRFFLMTNRTKLVPWNRYCLEDKVVRNQSRLVGLLCVSQHHIIEYPNWTSWGMIISMPFLLVTFLVYLLLPDRNLHQKALMFYVLALFFAYILLVTINLSQNISDPWCSVVGYATLFSFMVSFFWMNVICFDIWYTFSGGRGFAGSKKSSERKRLIVYGVYAFGMPLLLVVLIYVLDIYLPENSVHRPDVGRTKCFLSDGWANLWYFYGEAGILVMANIIFFALTALKIRKVKQETSMLKHSDSKRHSYEKDKQNQVPVSFWFNLYVKLLFAMGVNWSMEVISWLVNWQTDADVQYIFYITDFFNAVYGVWIFLIFVFKRKIWMLLKKRYYNLIGKPHLAHTVTSTQTRTSNYSSTNYSTADTHLADRGSTTNGNGRQVPEEVALRQVT